MLVLNQLLKYLSRSSGRQADISVLQLDTNKIFSLFEQNSIQGNKIVGVSACGILSEILSLENQNSALI